MKLSKDYFSNTRALVVGDVMLDRYWFGSVSRISPEAPVPVLAVDDEQVRAGGAANVAHNLLALGAQSNLLSVVGDDEPGRELSNIIKDFGGDVELLEDKSIKTIVKLRMMAQNHQLLRADFDQPPSDAALQELNKSYEQALQSADVVILSDYGKGNLKNIESLIALANKYSVPVIVDPKGSNFERYKGASMITPNMKEFEQVAGEVESENDFQQKAIELCNKLQLDGLLVTRSEKGMALFSQEGSVTESAARALEVYDVSGAGDTVIAIMALASVSDLNAQQSLDLANTVAAIVVGKVGTAVASIDEVIAKVNK